MISQNKGTQLFDWIENSEGVTIKSKKLSFNTISIKHGDQRLPILREFYDKGDNPLFNVVFFMILNSQLLKSQSIPNKKIYTTYDKKRAAGEKTKPSPLNRSLF